MINTDGQPMAHMVSYPASEVIDIPDISDGTVPFTFPYGERKFQNDIMQDILSVLVNKEHLLMESGTGTGKTISTLAPSVAFALTNGKRILYLTRTNSQQTQVILEMRAIISHIEDQGHMLPEGRIPAIGLQGRKNMCCMVGVDPEFEESTSEELSRLCNRLKQTTRSTMGTVPSTLPGKSVHGTKGSVTERKGSGPHPNRGNGAQRDRNKICPFYAATLTTDLKVIAETLCRDIPTAEEFIPRMTEEGLCPYELNKTFVERSLVVTAPYIYLFDSGLRHHFLDWMGSALEDLIIIVDEAHNLPNYARELVSSNLSTITLDRAASEAKEFGKDGALKVLETMEIPELTKRLQEIILELEEEYVIEEDGLVPPYELEEELMIGFKLTSNKLRKAVGELINHGLAIQDERLKQGRLPRSYIHAMGHFLMWWMEMESTRYIKLIRGGENPTLELYCMDPSEVIQIVKSCHSSIHISGTLRPLEEYRISSGLPRITRQRIFPSPFPAKNRIVLFKSGVTTRYEDLTVQMTHQLLDLTLSICNRIERNIMVFFPSFRLLSTFLDSGFTFSLERPLFVEEQGLPQAETMARVDEFKRRGGVFMSVIGGRLSEGMDFPADVLEIVILEGIPYPKPTARQRALQHYYEVRFGKGWEYTVKAPTTRKVLQSIGRLIRTEHDRGVAIILDKRAVHFKEDIPDLKESENVVEDILQFFG
jgi:DNA excision repair protein ERCC-2